MVQTKFMHCIMHLMETHSIMIVTVKLGCHRIVEVAVYLEEKYLQGGHYFLQDLLSGGDGVELLFKFYGITW